jgi:hypothetical protein
MSMLVASKLIDSFLNGQYFAVSSVIFPHSKNSLVAMVRDLNFGGAPRCVCA